jgi:hypothetical protein
MLILQSFHASMRVVHCSGWVYIASQQRAYAAGLA